MTGASHPFFGNQYTDGGYIIGSFKFPNGLTQEVGERLAKVAVPNSIPTDIGAIPSIHSRAKNKWIMPAIIIATIAATGVCFVCRHFKKKGIINIPNVGVCEHCGEPLTGAELISVVGNPYIVCKKCGEKNYAHYHGETNCASASASTDENDNQ